MYKMCPKIKRNFLVGIETFIEIVLHSTTAKFYVAMTNEVSGFLTLENSLPSLF